MTFETIALKPKTHSATNTENGGNKDHKNNGECFRSSYIALLGSFKNGFSALKATTMAGGAVTCI